MSTETKFDVVLRGYDRTQVDAVVRRLEVALDPANAGERASLQQQLRDLAFDIRLRGYDRQQVDAFILTVSARLNAI